MRYLPLAEQDNLRWLVAENIDHWYKHNLHDNNETPKYEERIVSYIKKHFKNNETMITKADKGNSISVLKTIN